MKMQVSQGRKGVMVAALLVALCPVLAAAAGVSQGYRTTEQVEVGALVGVSSSDAQAAQLADYRRSDSLIGVAVRGDTSTLAVSPGAAQVQVASTGTAEVFVSTVAGSIKSGDPITTSPTKGVGMRATESTKIIGFALADFDESKATLSTEVKSESGANSMSVKIGKVPVQLQVVYYVAPEERSPIPPVVRGFASAIAGKQVTPLRIMIAGGILLATIVAVAIILFAAVRSSIISIGRNPLAHRQIYRGLLRVILISIVILLVGGGAVYIVLRT